MSNQEPRRYKEGRQRHSLRYGIAGVEYEDGRNQQVWLKLLVRATGSEGIQLHDQVTDLGPGTSKHLFYAIVGCDWQKLQLLDEGYDDKPPLP
jgi:hypothetical protein